MDASPPSDSVAKTGSSRTGKGSGAAQGGSDPDAGVLQSFGGLAAMLGVGLLLGFSGPLTHGWLPPLLGACIAVVVVTLRNAAPHDTAWALARVPQRGRMVVVVLAGLVTAVLCVVAARSIGALLIAFGGAHFALVVVLFAALGLGGRRLGRAALPVGLVLGLAAIVAGVYGTRYDEAGSGARGSMHSGPIHGIHPFQMTAVIIDGYGPFDLPINDYVEPDGSKGYSPAQLAEVLERAVHTAAEVHFPNGPQRARAALLGAQAGYVMTPAVRERVDSDPAVAEQPRFWLRSGSFGRKSWVEFVCPGRRDDPRGPAEDNLMNRMCPDKYASEASAGLGVTGRWPGYVEFRGNPRLGLAPWLGWTRSHDRIGAQVIEREQRWIAWMVLAFGVLCVAASSLGAGRPAQGVARLGGLVGGIAVAVLCVALLGAAAPPVLPALQWSSIPLVPGALIPVGLVLLWLVGGIPRLHRGPTGNGRAGWSVRLVAIAACLVSLGVAANVGSAVWAWPAAIVAPGGLALEPLVVSLAEVSFDTLGHRVGWTIFEWEGAIAATFVVVLLAAIVSLLLRTYALARYAMTPMSAPPEATAVEATAAETTAAAATEAGRSQIAALILLVGIVGLAAALVVSRKTVGGFTLVPGAVGLSIVLQSALALIRRRGLAPAGSLRWRLQSAGHVGWTAVAIFLVLTPLGLAARAGEPLHPFVLVCMLGGCTAALSALVLLFVPRPGSA